MQTIEKERKLIYVFELLRAKNNGKIKSRGFMSDVYYKIINYKELLNVYPEHKNTENWKSWIQENVENLYKKHKAFLNKF